MNIIIIYFTNIIWLSTKVVFKELIINYFIERYSIISLFKQDMTINPLKILEKKERYKSNQYKV